MMAIWWEQVQLQMMIKLIAKYLYSVVSLCNKVTNQACITAKEVVVRKHT